MKKSTRGTLFLVTTALVLGGCGKKEEAAPVVDSTPAVNPTPTTETAATPTPTPTPTTPAPAPTPDAIPAVAPTPPPPAISAAAIKQRQEMVVKAEEELKKLKTPKTDQERFERNLNWLTMIQYGDRAKREEIMKQIREARLTPQEAAELEKLRQYYNVKF